MLNVCIVSIHVCRVFLSLGVFYGALLWGIFFCLHFPGLFGKNTFLTLSPGGWEADWLRPSLEQLEWFNEFYEEEDIVFAVWEPENWDVEIEEDNPLPAA